MCDVLDALTYEDEYAVEPIHVKESIADIFYQAMPDGTTATEFLYDLLVLYGESEARARAKLAKTLKAKG